MHNANIRLIQSREVAKLGAFLFCEENGYVSKEFNGY